MEIELKKRPKNATIIEGFPGFGLVGTITTEFLIDHLNAERIGSIWLSEMDPVVAVHGKDIIEPIGLFYSKKYNLIIVHAITEVKGIEWKLASAIGDLAKQINAREIVSLEGVGLLGKNDKDGVYFYSPKNWKKFENLEIPPLEEGIVVGITAALILRMKDVPISCIFAETKSKLPDSRAAANVVKVLDKYLDLKVDYKPLLKQAEEVEDKIKSLLKNTKNVSDLKTKKETSYLG
ncbi:proteasome assembly chaperone family protein [archaeon]|jgi:uncharacterized protein|nr:proteasome assembly chaperone family protein [archaeon]MBT6824084.1 proteasome assembly chaperone family protein [archaeon]MBT7107071.1 proteasome assembly chaperone family protein [archaeon]MBT7297683.1 proteasome assembly chaperone family protein [archaeon]